MHLCSSMQRTRVKGTMVRQSSSPDTEPDFYSMPPVGLGQGDTQMPAKVDKTREDGGPAFDFTSPGGSSLAMPPLAPGISSYTGKPGSKDQGDSFGLPPIEDHIIQDALLLQPSTDSSADDLAFHPWGTKYMRHLQARANPLHIFKQIQQDASERRSDEEESHGSHPEKDSDSGSSPGGAAAGGDPKAPGKVDVDMVGFLEEVDLESDQDECLESEEAMARILDQDAIQISEV